jgi:thiol-disulfide isomerase/thioredoxin
MLIPKERLILIGVAVAVAAVAAWWMRDSLAPVSLEPKVLPVERSAPPGLVPPDLRAEAPKPAAPAGPRPVTLRDGKVRDLAKAPGKLLVVHFWATWCPPCVEELPGLLAYANSVMGDPSVEVLAVSVDTDWKTVDAFLEKTKATGLPVALDPARATAKAFGTEKFPETWFLDPSGKVIEAFIGPAQWGHPETRKRLAALLEQTRKGLPGRTVGK